ncbi:uncharacterized protein MYCFIDRAFT_195805 [Pseudocercospora fijiensis CIRAD86]|uniref:Uncharacterized protein n=1 Tax=Pseudocercospora fijiensis (strain CIRAD86) TaxID=383855 RepID=M3B6A7_PSEFD|nr:uncharacterized protein MYCFIDRAFT_195805 [Pseudocercospora fijiensis CIRAD86]EME84868.1 hypothetical protein MYCFIDRAFT_195805 [Pseudocercospora fijiensis CIRAD86]
MAPRFGSENHLLDLTPRQILQQVAEQRGQASYWAGKVSIWVLIHNASNDMLLKVPSRSTQAGPQFPAFEDIPQITVVRETMTAEGQLVNEVHDRRDEAGNSTVSKLVRDLVMCTSHPASVGGVAVLDARSANDLLRFQIIVTCRVQSAFLFGASMTGLQWLSEKDLTTVDTGTIAKKLGKDGLSSLFAALEAWKCSQVAVRTNVASGNEATSNPSDVEEEEEEEALSITDGDLSDEEPDQHGEESEGLDDLPDLVADDGGSPASEEVAAGAELVRFNTTLPHPAVGERRPSGFVTNLGRFAMPAEKIAGRRVVRRMKTARNSAVMDSKLLKGHADWKDLRKKLQ